MKYIEKLNGEVENIDRNHILVKKTAVPSPILRPCISNKMRSKINKDFSFFASCLALISKSDLTDHQQIEK